MDMPHLMDDVEFNGVKYYISTVKIIRDLDIYETMIFPYDNKGNINWDTTVYTEACGNKNEAKMRHHYICAHINEFI